MYISPNLIKLIIFLVRLNTLVNDGQGLLELQTCCKNETYLTATFQKSCETWKVKVWMTRSSMLWNIYKLFYLLSDIKITPHPPAQHFVSLVTLKISRDIATKILQYNNSLILPFTELFLILVLLFYWRR